MILILLHLSRGDDSRSSPSYLYSAPDPLTARLPPASNTQDCTSFSLFLSVKLAAQQ